MRIVACTSPTHRPLTEDWFLATLPAGFRPDVSEAPQVCPTGEFRRDGWREQMNLKVGAILERLDTPGEVFVFSDVDVRFFQDFSPAVALDLLGDDDMAFQIGGVEGRVCGGFFVLRVGDAVRELFERVAERLHTGTNPGDEEAINEELGVVHTRGAGRLQRLPGPVSRIGCHLACELALRRRHDDRLVSWHLLPTTVWSPGLSNPGIWEPGDPLHVPRGILVHHANYTVGIENKHAQLTAVEEIVRSRG